MREDRDRERDLRLAAELGRLPAPALPAGLAARIVRNATRLAQYEDVAAMAIETAGGVVAAPRRRRWLAPAFGAAVAASLLAAVFVHPGPDQPAPPAARAQVAQNTPPAPVPAADAPVAVDAAATQAADRPGAPAGPADAHRTARGQLAGPGDAAPEPSPRVQPGPAAESTGPEPQSPAPASKPAAVGPQATPPQQALVGPPDDNDDLGATLPQGSPASGFGISGAGAPDLSGPPAQGRGGRSGGMPRF